MPKVSIIIPVYNVERYLRECLDSVVGQTMTDIEMICIEDCSTDHSWEILQEYAQREPRMILLRNERNSGLSYTRNRGIAVARGEYILFVDSDDYIVNDAAEKMYRIAKENDLDVLRFLYIDYIESKHKMSKLTVKEACEDFFDQIYSGQELLHYVSVNGPDVFTGWANFVKTEWLVKHKIYFPVGVYYEDTTFSMNVYKFARRSMYISEMPYVHRVRENSIITSPVTAKHTYSYIAQLLRLRKMYTDRPPDEGEPLHLFYVALQSVYFQWRQQRFSFLNMDRPKPDLTGWSQEEIEEFNSVYPEIDDYQLVRDHLELLRSSKVYLYGAGQYAKRYITILDTYDVEIAGVLVTNPGASKHSFFGHPIQGIDDCPIDVEHDVVLLAVSEKLRGEMLAVLKEKKVKYVI